MTFPLFPNPYPIFMSDGAVPTPSPYACQLYVNNQTLYWVDNQSNVYQLLPPPVVSTARAYFGDGSDGAAVFDGSATPAGSVKFNSTTYGLNRDVYYTSMTVSAGVTVGTTGWRLFCTGTITIPATAFVSNDGLPGTLGFGNAGGAAGPHNTIGGGGTGAGAAAPASGGANGLTGGQISPGGFGGNAGAGGNGSTRTGGIGGTVSQGTIAVPRMVPEAILGAVTTANSGTLAMTMVAGGAGGGSGAASDGGGTPCSGGGGGGTMVISTAVLAGAGGITARGGAGGGGAASPSGSGGGGGGGVIILVYGSKSGWSGSLIVTGGAAGTGGFAAAVAGSSGQTFQIAG